jgi:predicted dehydrogenase
VSSVRAVRTLRVGFLGAGLIATYHSKMIRRAGLDGDGTIVRAGVHDPDAERAALFARASGHQPMATEDEVLDSCDAVYVCTWTSEHRRLVEAAAQRGCAVFVEKPLATSLDDARAIVAALQYAGVTNQVGLVLRRSPAFVMARHLITDRAAGKPLAVVFRDDQFIPIQGDYGSTWRADVTKAGAGTLLEHSIHDIDLLHFLIGPIASVNALSSNHHGHDGIEDVMTANVRFARGTSGTLASIWHDNLARPSARRVEVFCARRYVHVEGDDWFGPVSWTDADGSEGRLDGAALEAAAGDLLAGPANPDEAFLRAAASDQPAWPDASVALVAHRVADAIYRSAAGDGTTVRMPSS